MSLHCTALSRAPRALRRGLAVGLALACAPALAASEDAPRSGEAPEAIAREAEPEAARSRYGAEDWSALLAGEVVQRSRTIDAPGSATGRSARAAVVLDAPPERVWSVLMDHRAWPRIFPRLKELELLSEDAEGTHLRHVAEVFWMDFTWHTVRRAEPAQGRIAVQLDPERPGDLEAAESHWQLVPLDGGARTLVEFRTQMSVSGVPGWVVESLTESGLPDQLRALREEVRRRSAQAEARAAAGSA